MKIKIMVAVSENGVSGTVHPNEENSSIPWYLPRDMKNVRERTIGNKIVISKKTYETIPEKRRPLKDRINIVMTHNKDYDPGHSDVKVAHSKEEVLEYAATGDGDLWILGGTEIYNLFMDVADEIHLTRVHAQINVADPVMGPNFNFDKFGIPAGFMLASRESYDADDKNEYPTTDLVFKRKLVEEDIRVLQKAAKVEYSKYPKHYVESPYEDLLKHILYHGVSKTDRTGTGTISVFGYQMRFDLSEGFPLITTKKLHLKSIIYELLWFIAGDTNIQYLCKNKCNIWNDWPYAKFKKSPDFNNETMKEFGDKIANDDVFAAQWGDLGPVYGYQWRHWPDGHGGEIDQLKNLIHNLKNSPDSRRHIISAWNVADIEEMTLPPCHLLFQFYVAEGKLSCQLYQRSADAFLGVPFNIASYALFTMMIAQVCDLELGEFVHTFGDLHIYANHFDQVVQQLIRIPFPDSNMVINSDVKNIFDFKYEDFTLENYQHYPEIKAPIAV